MAQFSHFHKNELSTHSTLTLPTLQLILTQVANSIVTTYNHNFFSEDVAVVKLLTPQSWLFSKHTRQLINESVGTFRSLQAAVQEASQASSNGGEALDLTPVLIKKTREYR